MKKIAFTCLLWVNKPQINYLFSLNPWEVIISGPVINLPVNQLITLQYLKNILLTVTSSDGSAPTRKLKCSSVERDTGRNFSRVIAQVNYEW